MVRFGLYWGVSLLQFCIGAERPHKISKKARAGVEFYTAKIIGGFLPDNITEICPPFIMFHTE